jgi:hypothetical protein
VIHRDIKPGNILLSRDNAPFFPTSEWQSWQAARTSPIRIVCWARRRTSAPEMWRDEETGVFTDLYALGVTIFEMLRGSPPFTRPILSISRLMRDHLEKPPPPLVGTVPGVPRAVEAVVHKLLSKKPEDRYGSAQEVAEAFQRAVQVCDDPTKFSTRPARQVSVEQRGSQVTAPVAAHTRPFMIGVETATIDDAQLTYVPRKSPKRRRMRAVGALLLAVLLLIGAGRGNTLVQELETVASVRRDGLAAAQRTVLTTSGSVQSTTASPGGCFNSPPPVGLIPAPAGPSSPSEKPGQGQGKGNGPGNGNGGGGGHGNGGGQGNGNGRGRGG